MIFAGCAILAAKCPLTMPYTLSKSKNEIFRYFACTCLIYISSYKWWGNQRYITEYKVKECQVPERYDTNKIFSIFPACKIHYTKLFHHLSRIKEELCFEYWHWENCQPFYLKWIIIVLHKLADLKEAAEAAKHELRLKNPTSCLMLRINWTSLAMVLRGLWEYSKG